MPKKTAFGGLLPARHLLHPEFQLQLFVPVLRLAPLIVPPEHLRGALRFLPVAGHGVIAVSLRLEPARLRILPAHHDPNFSALTGTGTLSTCRHPSEHWNLLWDVNISP